MHPLLAEATGTSFLIAFLGAGGVVGAITGFFKLRGERDSAVVSQAKGAMETMDDLNQALERSLDRANERADFYKKLYERERAEKNDLIRRWGPFPNGDDEG